MKRRILVELLVDWEEYEDVCDELIAEDALQMAYHGVTVKVLKRDIADKIYDILVEAGAAESQRNAFFDYYHTDGDEWRFCGKLGFGGKYRKRTNHIDCYSGDLTEDRETLIELINFELDCLKNREGCVV